MSTLLLEGLEALLHKLGASSIKAILEDFNLPPDHGRILSRPIDIYRVYLALILNKLIPESTPVSSYESFQSTSVLSNGDLILPVPRLRLKGKPPADQCTQLATNFPDDHPLLHKPTSHGIHLPIFFAKRSLSHLILPYVFDRQDMYGQDRGIGRVTSATEHKRKKVIVEFSSPNIAKEFHAGRTKILKQSLPGSLC